MFHIRTEPFSNLAQLFVYIQIIDWTLDNLLFFDTLLTRIEILWDLLSNSYSS